MLRPQLAKVPGVVAVASSPPSLGQDGRSPPVQLVLQTSGSYEELAEVTERFVRAVEDWPGIADVSGELNLETPQLDVDLRRQKIADLGLNVDSVGRTLESSWPAGRSPLQPRCGAVRGHRAGRRCRPKGRTICPDLCPRPRRGDDPALQPRQVEETVAAKELTRFNQLRRPRSPRRGPRLHDRPGAGPFHQVARECCPAIPFDYRAIARVRAGRQLDPADLRAGAGVHLPAAGGAVRELPRPLLIMVTVPLSMAGAFLALHLTGGTLNVYSQIGLVTLIGLITKHGILIVEFANKPWPRARPGATLRCTRPSCACARS